jgi:hypothetical protein
MLTAYLAKKLTFATPGPCRSPVVPDGCQVSFEVHGRALPVHVVVTSVAGVGPYTLTLDVQ